MVDISGKKPKMVFSLCILMLLISLQAWGVEVCPGSMMTITGPDTPSDGAQYTASGGVPPYAWSASRGSISPLGAISVSGVCGPSTITVTDKCGSKSAKTIRMPLGEWRTIYDIAQAPDQPKNCEVEMEPWFTSCHRNSGGYLDGANAIYWVAIIDRSRLAPGTPICPDLSQGWCTGPSAPPSGSCANYANPPDVDMSSCWNTYGTPFGLQPMINHIDGWRCKCDLHLIALSSSAQTITPSAGETTTFSWTISDPANIPITWTLNVAGKTLSGSGTSITWDGKDASGKIVPPGTYTATLTATNSDGCVDSKSLTITVIAPPNNCLLSIKS